MSSTTDNGSPRPHPRMPLSKATTGRLLQRMLDRAELGDADCADRLVRLATGRPPPRRAIKPIDITAAIRTGKKNIRSAAE